MAGAGPWRPSFVASMPGDDDFSALSYLFYKTLILFVNIRPIVFHLLLHFVCFLKLFFFSLKVFQLFHDIRIDKVGNILSIHDLR